MRSADANQKALPATRRTPVLSSASSAAAKGTDSGGEGSGPNGSASAISRSAPGRPPEMPAPLRPSSNQVDAVHRDDFPGVELEHIVEVVDALQHEVDVARVAGLAEEVGALG